MIRNFFQFFTLFFAVILIAGCVTTSSVSTEPIVVEEWDVSAGHAVNAAEFLGADLMRGVSHHVSPDAILVGTFLRYTIKTADETMIITGTEAAKVRIREIYATETLKSRSTPGTMLNAVKDRTVNIVQTPLRVGGTLAQRANDVDTAGEAILFIPKQVGQAAGLLIDGVGELAVTGVRITSGAADTQCTGMDCISKAGNDIWSGMNSLAGKHNASRRLHREFGTDPETMNQTYRRQIDRVAYADAYVSTTIKLGMGQAGIDYISPAFTGVGYYNNGEFVGQYEDARRQRNHEKAAMISWGANPIFVDSFYLNSAFTKHYRRRFFAALDAISDKNFAVELFHQSADIVPRHVAESRVVIYEYIAAYEMAGDVSAYVGTAPAPLFVTGDGISILPIYADYLTWTPALSDDLRRLRRQSTRAALHVLGTADADVAQRASQMGLDVVVLSEMARQ